MTTPSLNAVAHCIEVSGGNATNNWRVSSNITRQARWEIDVNSTNHQTHMISIDSNDIGDNNHYWDANDAFHANQIFLYGNPASSPASGTYGYVYIFNNVIHGALSWATGHIFLSKQMDGPVYIFNNIIRPTSSDTAAVNGRCSVGAVKHALEPDQRCLDVEQRYRLLGGVWADFQRH